MTAHSNSDLGKPDLETLDYRVTRKAITRLDHLTSFACRIVGPVGVKEIRQVLKGVQLYVLCSLIIVVALFLLLDPFEYYYSQTSAYSRDWFSRFESWYYLLAFPMFLFIPFWLFRSMAVEFKQQTFELVQVTDVSAYQIVLGKMVVAAVQWLVYSSLLLPNLIFETAAPTIGYWDVAIRLLVLFGITMMLASFAILLASVVRKATWQIAGMLAVLITGTFFVFFLPYIFSQAKAMVFAENKRIVEFSADYVYGSIVASYLLTLAFSLFAVAQLLNPNLNRSAPFRLGILSIQVTIAILIAWMIKGNYEKDTHWIGAYLLALLFTAIFLGSVAAGDTSMPSNRVLRDNRQVWKRLLCWLLLPGNRRGFAFSVVSIVVIASVLTYVMYSEYGNPLPLKWTRYEIALRLVVSYTIIFVGCALLVGLLVPSEKTQGRGGTRVGLAGITGTGLVVLGTIVPNVIELLRNGAIGSVYDSIFLTDIMTSVMYFSTHNSNASDWVLTVHWIVVAIILVPVLLFFVRQEIAEARQIRSL